MGQPTDVNVLDAAFFGRRASSIASEEMPMAFLNVRVPMPAGRGHEFDVFPQVLRRIVAIVFFQRPRQQQRQLKIQGVFPRLEILVIMNAAPTPKWRLVMKNLASVVGRLIGGSPENAPTVRMSRR